MTTHATGPYDRADVDLADGTERLDLGSLLVPVAEGMELQVQVDEASGNVVLATVKMANAAVQVQPYAAPKSGGMWDDARPQIRDSVIASGGTAQEVDGAFGLELHAEVKAEGTNALQTARFVGVDGPRWFLRAVFLGDAARPGAIADRFDEMVRGVVVVRGDGAMPVGAPIPMRLPAQPSADPAAAGRPSLDPFQRGPEITETR